MATKALVPNGGDDCAPQNLEQFARLLHAFIECSDSTQEIVVEMSAIVADEESTDDEREIATDAITEALFPGLVADMIEEHNDLVRSPGGREAAAEIRQEAIAFGDRVRALMTENDVNQDRLADAAGITQPAVSNLLTRNCRPQRRTIEKFAEALGVEPGELWPESNGDRAGENG